MFGILLPWFCWEEPRSGKQAEGMRFVYSVMTLCKTPCPKNPENIPTGDNPIMYSAQIPTFETKPTKPLHSYTNTADKFGNENFVHKRSDEWDCYELDS